MFLLISHGKLIQSLFQLILVEYSCVQGHKLGAVVDVLILHCPIRSPLATCSYLNLKNSVPYLHYPYFECSVTTNMWLVATVLESTDIDNFYTESFIG